MPTLTPSPFIIPSALAFTPTPMPTAIVRPISTPTNIPTLTQAPTNIAATDLRLGVIDRGMNCPLISEVIEIVLEQEFGIIVERVSYDTIEELFAALASMEEEKEIDLTLCVIYPDDRDYFTMYHGHITQIGRDLWASTEYQELLMINAGFNNSLKNMSCVYEFLQNLHFPENNMQDMDAKWWVERHLDDLLSGVNCAS